MIKQEGWQMGFTCPQCRQSGALDVTMAVNLPGDSRSDEITLQVLACPACGFRAVGVYEESRRGALDHEAWNHTGYLASPSAVDYAALLIGGCPQPSDAGCQCAAHRILNRLDANGTWSGLDLFNPGDAFALEWKAEQ